MREKGDYFAAPAQHPPPLCVMLLPLLPLCAAPPPSGRVHPLAEKGTRGNKGSTWQSRKDEDEKEEEEEEEEKTKEEEEEKKGGGIGRERVSDGARISPTFNGELWSQIAARVTTWRTVKGQITAAYISRPQTPATIPYHRPIDQGNPGWTAQPLIPEDSRGRGRTPIRPHRPLA
ncbi:hypothetical protein WH47_04557 [Habropoda laboriosa]|uniref:Uncharacterized protein n=1 Tax=Habropoda laboriosa TaxID=597456 RepID=A0A0L7R2B3_9HYME|nr:hypothetical protein WH47_04557 [Habropoda laboriosa]